METGRAAGGRVDVYPSASFIHMYLELVDMADRKKMTPEALRAALARSATVAEVFDEFEAQQRARQRR
jgi:hypothetical protein